MPRVYEQYKADRMRLLSRATWRAIAEQGVEHVTLDDVVAGSGVTVGTVYNYFGTRDELVNSAITTALVELEGALNSAIAELTDDPLQLFDAVLAAFAERAEHDPYAMATASMVASARPHLQPADPVVGARYERFIADVERHAWHWTREGRLSAGPSPRAWAIAMTSLLWGYFMQQALADEDLVPAHRAVLHAMLRDAAGAGTAPAA